MIARVRDPIDAWGGGQAPLHQVKSTSCTPHTLSNHVGQKGARTCTTNSGGGGKEENIPPPTPSEVMPHYNTYNRLRARLPFKKS
jgi:hypothetical protein